MEALIDYTEQAASRALRSVTHIIAALHDLAALIKRLVVIDPNSLSPLPAAQ